MKVFTWPVDSASAEWTATSIVGASILVKHEKAGRLFVQVKDPDVSRTRSYSICCNGQEYISLLLLFVFIQEMMYGIYIYNNYDFSLLYIEFGNFALRSNR